MKRLYYLTRDVESAELISQDIHESGITDWNFHVLSKRQGGLYKRHIHSANMLHKTDILHQIERGVLRGFAIGVGAAILLTQIPIHGSILPFSVLVSIVLGGIILGGWHGSLFGYQSENYKLKPFHDKIEQGYFLVMIDVSKKQLDMVEQLMQKQHPEARFCRLGSSFVRPFDEPSQVSF